jgi:hypothetical protein
MRRFSVFILIIGLSSSAFAGEPPGQGYGVGMDSCSTFAAAYKRQPKFSEDLYFAWAEGFLSGLNLEATADYLPARNLASIQADSAKVEIRSYCDRHPREPYFGAVVAIYNSLPVVSKNPK